MTHTHFAATCWTLLSQLTTYELCTLGSSCVTFATLIAANSLMITYYAGWLPIIVGNTVPSVVSCAHMIRVECNNITYIVVVCAEGMSANLNPSTTGCDIQCDITTWYTGLGPSALFQAVRNVNWVNTLYWLWVRVQILLHGVAWHAFLLFD